jgi:hypothetical protein
LRRAISYKRWYKNKRLLIPLFSSIGDGGEGENPEQATTCESTGLILGRAGFKFWEIGHMTMSLPLRVGRFIAVAFCMALAAGGLVLLVCLFPDSRPLTVFENICVYVSAVVSWPFFVFAAFNPASDPSFVVCILLSIASGLFWAFIVELLLMAKKRLLLQMPVDKINSNCTTTPS